MSFQQCRPTRSRVETLARVGLPRLEDTVGTEVLSVCLGRSLSDLWGRSSIGMSLSRSPEMGVVRPEPSDVSLRSYLSNVRRGRNPCGPERFRSADCRRKRLGPSPGTSPDQFPNPSLPGRLHHGWNPRGPITYDPPPWQVKPDCCINFAFYQIVSRVTHRSPQLLITTR